jgi:Meckel syndrome type 1 protein
MNQITPPPSDDDLPDERELAALYARLPKVEPDASLDAAVLAEATRATPVSRRPRWPVALASAAVLVLAVGVAWQVRELHPVPSAMRTAAAPPASKPAPATPAGSAPDQRSSAYVGAASAAKPAQRAQLHRTPAPPIAAQITAAPAPEPAAAPTPPVPAAPPSPPSPSAPQAAVMSAAPAPSPQRYEAAPASSGVLRENMAAKVAADATAPNALGPDDRVGEIRRLLGSGNRAQALRELKELRRRYPHYDLPQDLRDLNP